jgi:uncharacterized protein YkwD
MAGILAKARWLAAAALVATAFAVLELGAPTPAGAQALRGANCPNAQAKAGEASTLELKRAITCLVAQTRKQADRKPLKSERHLRKVASAHTKVMLRDDCFEHQCPGEEPLEDRIIDSGYLRPGDQRFGYAENTGFARTPAAMLRVWLRKDFHRRNLLGKRFKHVGIAVGKGAPKAGFDDADYATFTLIFAWRKP